ncbi:MAG: type II toxin-antitoxin system HicB family antitoxin [Candidatus Methanoperedens sp.]|nr:type II toxin-antitoxin system HicB family antitoxin [Candidatus Methanoperedens sp.]
MVSIQKEDKFFVARCPELGVTSQGESLEEAQANIKEAIELFAMIQESRNELSMNSYRYYSFVIQ